MARANGRSTLNVLDLLSVTTTRLTGAPSLTKTPSLPLSAAHVPAGAPTTATPTRMVTRASCLLRDSSSDMRRPASYWLVALRALLAGNLARHVAARVAARQQVASILPQHVVLFASHSADDFNDRT